MADNSANNKRIAKNTFLLYGRMLLLLLIGLYTSRVVLAALGVDDFGIYNVVGGIVAMFTMISGALSAAISRFITYELGTGNSEKLKRVFSTSVTIQLIFSGILIVLAETIGLWFLNNKLVIPDARLFAAHWVFQLSIVTFVVNLISVPYNATIIAHERMSAFAYISIIEAVAKLAVAWLITTTEHDKLILYAILLAVIAVAIRMIYSSYCAKHFEECHFRFKIDSGLLKDMFSFAGWNMIGATSAILRDQGGNILINMFGGPAVNAARGIAFQINSALMGFVTNFQMALNPQIIKNYASQNRDYMMQLIFQGSRLSFYIFFLMALPVFVSTPYILKLWLTIVPEHTVLFVRLVIIFSLSEALSVSLKTAMYATGKVKTYQICVGGLQLLNFPISYVLLRMGFMSEIIVVVAIAVSFLCLLARLIILKPMIGISPSKFMLKVFLNCAVVSILASILPIYLLSVFSQSFTSFIILSAISMLCSIVGILFAGCNKQERRMVFEKGLALYHRFLGGSK